VNGAGIYDGVIAAFNNVKRPPDIPIHMGQLWGAICNALGRSGAPRTALPEGYLEARKVEEKRLRALLNARAKPPPTVKKIFTKAMKATINGVKAKDIEAAWAKVSADPVARKRYDRLHAAAVAEHAAENEPDSDG
jgi:hypothetical protein